MSSLSDLARLLLFSKLALLWQDLHEIQPYPTQTPDPDVYSRFIRYNLNEEATLRVFSVISKTM